ncbi:MAG: T9SS type A sorting domain-containing protein [Bacteroidota bacterium]
MKLKAVLFTFLCLFAFSAFANGPFDANPMAPQTFPAEVQVYPNPSNGVFFIEVQETDLMQVEFKVVNLIGKTVKQETIDANQRLRIDLHDQPKGVYFVHLKAGNDTYMKRIVIQ